MLINNNVKVLTIILHNNIQYQSPLISSIVKKKRNMYEKMFKADVKKHIDAISSKYIIQGVTSDQAIMFLPAEAINTVHSKILNNIFSELY